MRVNRRFILTAAVMLTATMALAAEIPVYRVNGRITQSNIKGLEAFLANSVGEVFALKIKVPKSDGKLAAALENGKLAIFRAGSKDEFEIVASEGFEASGEDYVFDGFYQVENGGVHQGVTSLFISPDKAANALAADFKVQNLSAGRLNPNVRN
jgi:hypothetical protein